MTSKSEEVEQLFGGPRLTMLAGAACLRHMSTQVAFLQCSSLRAATPQRTVRNVQRMRSPVSASALRYIRASRADSSCVHARLLVIPRRGLPWV